MEKALLRLSEGKDKLQLSSFPPHVDVHLLLTDKSALESSSEFES